MQQTDGDMVFPALITGILVGASGMALLAVALFWLIR